MMKILIFVCLVFTLNATTIDLSQKNVFCVYKDFLPGSIHLSVEFVGENTATSSIQIYEPNTTQESLNLPAINHFSSEIVVNKTGEHIICFQNLDNSNKIVSFYITHSEEAKTSEKPIETDDINDIAKGLIELRRKLKQVSNNQHMRVEINTAHGEILKTVGNRIKYCFGFKIILAVVIAICQLWILKAFFEKKEPIKGTPVAQEMF